MLLETIRKRITEELLTRRVDRWVTGTIAVLLVVVGFLAGRWTSLTTNATPIVFQDLPGATNVSNEDLLRLATEPTATERPAATPTPRTASVRGAGTVTPDSRPTTPDSPLGAFVASANGKKYYHPSCKEVRRIKEENLVWFDSEEEAKESGYEPSKCVEKR